MQHVWRNDYVIEGQSAQWSNTCLFVMLAAQGGLTRVCSSCSLPKVA